MKTKTLALIALLLLLLVSACSGTPENNPVSEPAVNQPYNTADPNEANEAPVEEEEMEEPAEAGPITITDITGHTVTLEQLPQKIVIAGRATFMVQDAMYLFPEAASRIAGIENRRQSVYTFLPVIDPTLDDKTMFEANAGPEQIAPLNPDLVILKSFMAEQLGAPLEAIGIPVVYVDLETPEAFYQDIITLGQVFGNPERAEEIVDFYQQRVDNVADMTAGLTEEEKPSVLLLQYNAGDEIAFEIPPDEWLQTMMVEMAGGTPIWKGTGEAGGWTIVSLDQIAAWNPDQIYLIEYDGAANEVIAGLMADPLWQELSAVQNEQFYGFPVDFYSWDQPDTRWILGLQWLATMVQPELTAEIDILAEVNSFYAEMYGMSPADIEADVLPLLADDLP
jgi:iron complex transport system substrate-binding protein